MPSRRVAFRSMAAVLLLADHRALLAHATAHNCEGPRAPIQAVVDSAKHAVVITLGPCLVPALGTMSMPRMSAMAMMGHGPGHEDVRVHFTWPADVWMRSFDLKLFDRNHQRLSQPTTMHHLELIDFDRRQVLYPMVERVLG